MKWLISTGAFYPSTLGGPANTLYWLSKGLVSIGDTVYVVTTDDNIFDSNIKTDQWINKSNINIRYCSSLHFATLKMIWHSWKVMKDVEIVMISDLFQPQVLFTALLSILKNKKIIWSIRGELFPNALNKSRLKSLYISLVKRIINHNVCFHATSVEERDEVLHYFGKESKCIIIPNYIEMPAYYGRTIQNPPYFLYLGRIAPIKALEKLIEGSALSKSFTNSNYIFKIVGGVEKQFYEYYERLCRLIKEKNLDNKIIFTGAISGDEKYKMFANAHAMFLVSYSENFGNVVIESLSQGTPVVASKGTPWSQLDDKSSGFWIENAPQEIATAIDTFINMAESDYINMRACAKKFSDEYDVYKNINKWHNVVCSNGDT